MDEREKDAANPADDGPGVGSTGGGEAEAGRAGAGAEGRGGATPARGTGGAAQALAGPDRLGQSEVTPPPLTDEQKCRISLLKNIRYHEDREGHFAWINRALDLFVLVSGLGTVIALSDLLPHWLQIDGRWIAAVTSVVGAVQLVFDLGQRESLHGDLKRRFLALLADLEDENVKDTGRRMRALFGDEPPTFHAVDKLAYNAAMNALDRPHSFLLVVTPRQRFLRNWRRYEGVRFPRYEEAQRSRT